MEISSVFGLKWDELQIGKGQKESYFSIGLSMRTWFGFHVAISISGMCPTSVRNQGDKFAEFETGKPQIFNQMNTNRDNISEGGYALNTPGADFGDNNSNHSGNKKNPVKQRKTLILQVEIRSESQDIIEMVRNDMEAIVHDLSNGEMVLR